MKSFLTILLLTVLPVAAQAGLLNQLSGHPSPYLLLHAQDPVHWQSWGQEALDKARVENKLIYISSGYFACHWCHVMQQESYQNPEIAALLNEHFIPVKVDRELQPTLDAHLIEFVQRTRGRAGWPLNVFLTPEGYPVFGLTYSPRDSFKQVLTQLQQLWEEKHEELASTARLASIAVEKTRTQLRPESGAPMDRKALETALVSMALSLGDDMEGGFGRQNRFPMAPQWTALLERLVSTPDGALRELTVLTLDQMAGQGMRDHIGGGFFRYTVDPGWQIPHFEKMLYSQALLSRLYIRAAEVLNRPDYLTVARNTLDFSLKVLKGNEGAFIASLSAVDPENREGGGYLWSELQLEKLLNPEELAFARQRWGLEGDPVTQGAYLPMDAVRLETLAGRTGTSVEQLKTMEQNVREKLLVDSLSRSHPRDDKQLAAWNGLMLSALVEGARVLGDESYRKAASDLRDYLVTRLWDGERLLRARGPGGPLGQAALEDYAYVAAGLYDWAVFSGNRNDLALAEVMTRQAWKRFYEEDGWIGSDDSLLPGIALQELISDGPLPSPAALLIRLSFQLRVPELEVYGLKALEAGHETLREQPVWYATRVQVIFEFPSAGP
ncbi:MAG: thioredoxin domain-containing protein [Gammaproteobacteria bacterium]|nr:thioredoxin domain-containing protein [Gammaproteobacteria bacterium]